MIQAEPQGLLGLFVAFNLYVTCIPTLRPEYGVFFEKFFETNGCSFFTECTTRFEWIDFFNPCDMRDEFMKSEGSLNTN
jgi:hypothetical protein